MATKQTFFKLYWAKHLNYSSWIATAKDDKKVARCTKCNTTFNLSNIGEQALEPYMKEKKHSQRVSPNNFF